MEGQLLCGSVASVNFFLTVNCFLAGRWKDSTNVGCYLSVAVALVTESKNTPSFGGSELEDSGT